MAESCNTADITPPVEVHDAQAVALAPARARQTSNACSWLPLSMKTDSQLSRAVPFESSADASLAVASRVTALVVISGADSSQTKPVDMRGRRETASHAEAAIDE
eukprot:scaffold26716_cov71-Phaeocystis_antarctica.AAC.3